MEENEYDDNNKEELNKDTNVEEGENLEQNDKIEENENNEEKNEMNKNNNMDNNDMDNNNMDNNNMDNNNTDNNNMDNNMDNNNLENNNMEDNTDNNNNENNYNNENNEIEKNNINEDIEKNDTGKNDEIENNNEKNVIENNLEDNNNEQNEDNKIENNNTENIIENNNEENKEENNQEIKNEEEIPKLNLPPKHVENTEIKHQNDDYIDNVYSIENYLSENNEQENDKKEKKEEGKIKDKKKLKIEQLKDKLKNIPMYICTYKVVTYSAASTLAYMLKGKIVEKKILRTYQEFYLYQQALRKQWPCICVPEIPFTEDNIDNIENSELKARLLNHFLKIVSACDFFVNSKITSTFVKDDPNFKVKLFNVGDGDEKEISERYFKTFTQYVEDIKNTREKEKKVYEYIKLFQETQTKMNELTNIVEKEMNNIQYEQMAFDFAFKMFIDLENNMFDSKNYFKNINEEMKPLKEVSKIFIIFLE